MRLGVGVLVTGVSFLAIVTSCSSSDNTPGADGDDGGASSSSGSTSSSSSSSGSTTSSSSSSSGSTSSSGDGGSSGIIPGTHTDGAKNLDETDVDCGGTIADPTGQAKRCDVGKGCKVGTDCTSVACRYDGKCVAVSEKSCVLHHGGDTCGPAATQESCCMSMVAGGTTKVDKYPITAGRFRAFVDATNGDIRGWLTTNKPPNWDQANNALVPTKLDDTGQYISHEGVYQELGPGLFFGGDADPPLGGDQGCAVESYGARTYFVPDAISKADFNEINHYPQDDLDEKPLNCATYYMFSAFCAWDGGHLTTNAELDAAWGAHTYPWGETPKPGGWSDSWSNAAEAAADGTVSPAGATDQTHANYSYNFWAPTDRVCDPAHPNNPTWCDYSVHLSPPGRFPLGNGPFGHADLAGLVFNMTSTPHGAPTNNAANPNGIYWSKNGSWEGHQIPYPQTTGFDKLSKYLATGARCAR